jgi:hypothetical protein
MWRFRVLFCCILIVCVTSPVFAEGERGEIPENDPMMKYDRLYTKERFDEADLDGDGFLTWKEAVEGGYPFEGKKGKKRFSRADGDADGKLTLQEAKAYREWEKEKGRMKWEKMKGKEEGESQEGLVEPDSEGKEEGRRKKQYKHQMYTKERFNKADTDGDGFLSWDEAKSHSKGFEGEKGHKRFTHTDTDGDGKLSLKEMQAQKEWEVEHRKELRKRKGSGGN